MSYDIDLTDPETGKTIEFDEPHHATGGTYALGGSRDAWLNVTYNYSSILYRVLGKDGLRGIYGKTGAETIPLFQAAIAKLKDNVNPDYWKPTEGNVKAALRNLLSFAEKRPDGVWRGD